MSIRSVLTINSYFLVLSLVVFYLIIILIKMKTKNRGFANEIIPDSDHFFKLE